MTRYSRQTAFSKIGPEGQRKLLASRVAIVGIGALGTVIADSLCRAGVGFLRLIDRDCVELSNLQRQTLFSEKDAEERVPKATAACAHLSAVNSGIKLEPVVADLNALNAEEFIRDADLVLDGTDNMETRYLINEACHKLRVPWVYGGALGSMGTTMNILRDGPCFRCFLPQMPAPGSYPTCSAEGVLNMATGVVASMQSAEALKILTGSPDASRSVFVMDVWNNTADYISVQKNPDCLTCGQGRYELLGRPRRSYAVSLCGQDSFQVVPGELREKAGVRLDLLAEKLKAAGSVKLSRFMLSFGNGEVAFDLFADGRAIVKNVADEAAAKSVYAEYIGL